jgi:hypothetical protein
MGPDDPGVCPACRVWHLLAQGREASAPDELFGVSEQLAAALAWADGVSDGVTDVRENPCGASDTIVTLAAAVRELQSKVKYLDYHQRLSLENSLEQEDRAAKAEAALAEANSDCSRFCGDNERLLKALNAETVEGALHHIAALQQTLKAREAALAELRGHNLALRLAIVTALDSPAMMGSEDIDVLTAALEAAKEPTL